MNLPIGIFEEDIRPIQNQYPNIDLKEAIVTMQEDSVETLKKYL